MMAVTCGTCVYFDPTSEDGRTGACRRHAATIVPVGPFDPTGVWPRVRSLAWCGEYASPQSLAAKYLGRLKE